MFQAFLCFNSDDYSSLKPKVQFLNISEPIQNRVHDTEMSTVWKRCSFTRSELVLSSFWMHYCSVEETPGPHTRHRWFWCCGVLLGKEPATSWCNKQHQGFQIEAKLFMDCFVFYQNVWRLFLFLNFCVSHQNINVLHWTWPGPPLTQWDHTEPLTRVQSAAELGPTVCILFRSSLFDFWFLSQVKLTNRYSLWRHAG